MPYVALSVRGSRPDFTRDGSEIPARQVEAFFSLKPSFVGWIRNGPFDPWKEYVNDDSGVQQEN